MILPNTAYHTYENVPLRIQERSNNGATYDVGILKEDQAILMSLWADPRKEWLRIELDKEQQNGTSATQFFFDLSFLFQKIRNFYFSFTF